MASNRDGLGSSQDSSIGDVSNLSFESSFRLDPGYSNPGSESEKHPKGKRKRTTSQDKAILEAAYISNPKPDKAARLDIVRRVSLNEKEVQIWFQNRRQNDRRKSRPLSPQEIEALRHGGGINALSADPIPASIDPVPAPIGLPNIAGHPQGPPTEARPLHESEQNPDPNLNPNPNPHPASPAGVDSRPSSQPSPAAVFASAAVEGSLGGTPPSSQTQNVDAEVEPCVPSQIPYASFEYFSNRRNFENSFSTPSTLRRPGDESFRLDSLTSSTNPTAENSPSVLPPPSSSSSSQFRLSLSLDGKAELVSSQPSPPRSASLDAEQLPPVRTGRTLQRSQSALPGITLPPISTLTAHLPPQLPRGRSRDVHAWELCCEADTRDALTQQAENESSGSATAAINLLRSSSASSASLSKLVHNHHSAAVPPLPLNTSKRNGQNLRSSSRGGKKPRLGRTASSVARLQSLPSLAAAAAEQQNQYEIPKATVDNDDDDDDDDQDDVLIADKRRTKHLYRKRTLTEILLSPGGGDSDKENWSPDEDGNPMSTASHRAPRRSLAPPATSKPAATTTGSSSSINTRNPRRSAAARDVLGEQPAHPPRRPLGNRANTAPVSSLLALSAAAAGNTLGKKSGARESIGIFEDAVAHEDQENQTGTTKKGRDSSSEVERFMRGGEVSPSKRGDLDCVAGLLSLSQGNWR
ncbi:hypothetical protein F4780DRAFT_780415 [Xylariomycetidae sp. FL0641]|nr:hypothetical protein F4780DRAFT_780415 [Xylariomycetidae sp. FL0641]